MGGSHIFKGRYTAQTDESFVIFIIGLRVNRFWAFNKWIPVFNAMSPMLRELYENPDLGFLHTEFFIRWRGVTLVQYWRSFDHLESYSHGRTHATAWKKFNRLANRNQSVGIYHETFKVEKDNSESVYVNMPRSGLAKAGEHVPINRTLDTARQRINK